MIFLLYSQSSCGSSTLPPPHTALGESCDSMSGTLLGRVAVVTGGSGTIGQAIANKLLSQGASVVLTGRRFEKLQEVQSILLSSYPGSNVSIIASDVSSEDSVVDLFRRIDQIHGGLDLLVNNAGE